MLPPLDVANHLYEGAVTIERLRIQTTKEVPMSDSLFLQSVESDKSAVFACRCHCEEDGAFKPEFIRAVAQQLIRDVIGNSVGGNVLKVYKGVGR